jgi:8-oxo-dGTP pyrophosphatase MutT (NUDIX family)
MVTPALLPALRARLLASEPREATGSKRAAVAAVLLPREAALEVLFIRRAERAGDLWSGHMAFPGGRSEPEDASLLDTAIRETREEVGLDLAVHGELVGRLEDLPAIGRGKEQGMVVTPFVFVLRDEPVLQLNHEVVEVVWAKLALLYEGAVDTTIDYPFEGKSLTLPGYRVGEHIVWGMTHRMLGFLFDAIRACAADT